MDRLRFNQDHNWTYNYLETPSLAAVFGAIIMKSTWVDNVSWHAAYHLATFRWLMHVGQIFPSFSSSTHRTALCLIHYPPSAVC
jgi:hypothetical protein